MAAGMPHGAAVACKGSGAARALQCLQSNHDVRPTSMPACLGGPGVHPDALHCPGRGACRCIEISKRGIWSPAAVAYDRPDLDYSLLALDFMSPGALGAGLARLSLDLAAGTVGRGGGGCRACRRQAGSACVLRP